MKKRLLLKCVFVAYGAILIKVMVFKEIPVIRIGKMMFNFGGSHEAPANFMPFRTIWPYLRGDKGLLIAAINLAGNIVLLVPAGWLVPLIFQNMDWKKMLALAVAAGCCIEGMQAFLQVGIFDIDDILLNGLGVMIGYWMHTIFTKMDRAVKLKMLFVIAGIVVVTTTALYGFTMCHQQQAPVSFQPVAENRQTDSIANEKITDVRGIDPCRGTGGTGQIVRLGNRSITIQRHDGINEMINLTDKTSIKNAVRSLLQSDLKIGDRVTVVVLSNHVATTVLVCRDAGL